MAAKIPGNGIDANGQEIILDADADTTITVDTDDQIDFKTGGSDRMHIESGGNVGIGTSSTQAMLHVLKNDSGALNDSNSDNFMIEDTSATGMTIGSSTSGEGHIYFSDSDDADVGTVSYFHGSNYMRFRSNASEALRFTGQEVSTGGETAPDVDAGGITINHGANDGLALSFKNSDVSHGMSGATEVDTYGQLQKAGAGDGGFRIMGFCDGTADVMQIMGFSNGAQNTDTTGSGATVELFGAKKSGTGLADLASDENLVAFRQYGGTTRFIMKSDGTVHASDTSWATSLDTYDDAQLCRSMDMLPAESTREGFISDKWTEMVKYNIDDLVDAGIYTKDGKDMIEKGETPFFRVQPLLRLHNGAIWQNYTKHQKLAEAVYEMAKEALGEDKADAILEKHDIKLLN